MKLPIKITTKTGHTCTLELEGDKYIMKGATGTHRLSEHCTDTKRLQAHWIGFVDNNGGMPQTEAERYFTHIDSADIELADLALSQCNVSYIDGRNEIGSYIIEVYTFTDGSAIGFLEGFDADYLENILDEIGHYKH